MPFTRIRGKMLLCFLKVKTQKGVKKNLQTHRFSVWQKIKIHVYMCYYSVFVSGNQYWMLRQLKLEEGFPRSISTLGFPSRIKSVDAALHFRDEGYTVFFTGDECWRYVRS